MFLNFDVMFWSRFSHRHGMSLVAAEFIKCQNIFYHLFSNEDNTYIIYSGHSMILMGSIHVKSLNNLHYDYGLLPYLH